MESKFIIYAEGEGCKIEALCFDEAEAENTFKDLEETGELVIRDGIGYERVKPKYAFLLNTEREYKGELNTLGGDCNECRNLEKEVERLQEENTKLKAEQGGE